jgi:hypothetical protein
MGGEAEDDVFCEREGRHFAATEFYDLEGWGLVHNVTPLHTKEGTIVDPHGKPVNLPDAIPLPEEEQP